ncbi:MAG: hypothetical protein J5825_02595 [Lachnospiraceae bacterium]|nr:hypothetical protein [Lachnospiraceae bacterium]
MGLFSKIKANLEAAKEQEKLYKAKTDAEKAKEALRPEIKELHFVPLDPSVADAQDLMNAKCRHENTKYKKLFVECIKAGKAEYAEAVGICTTSKWVGTQKSMGDYFSDDKDKGTPIYRDYIKVADMNGKVHKRLIATMNNICLENDDDLSFENADNPDIVDVNTKRHIFILHYFLGKKEMYMALTEEEFADLSKVIDYVFFDMELFIDEICFWN